MLANLLDNHLSYDYNIIEYSNILELKKRGVKMQGRWIDKIFMGYESDAERTLPLRSKDVEEKEEKAYNEFFNSLTDEQQKNMYNFLLKKVRVRRLNRK